MGPERGHAERADAPPPHAGVALRRRHDVLVDVQLAQARVSRVGLVVKILPKVWKVRSRLYQSPFLQLSAYVAASFKIYKNGTLLHRS